MTVDTESQDRKDPVGFFDLPTELRYQIYALALDLEARYKEYRRRRDPCAHKTLYDLPLTRVSRLVRHETYKMSCAKTLKSFPIHTKQGDIVPASVENLQNLTSRTLANLGRFTLIVRDSCLETSLHPVLSAAGHFPCLESGIFTGLSVAYLRLSPQRIEADRMRTMYHRYSSPQPAEVVGDIEALIAAVFRPDRTAHVSMDRLRTFCKGIYQMRPDFARLSKEDMEAELVRFASLVRHWNRVGECTNR